jgi:hypothetical protein
VSDGCISSGSSSTSSTRIRLSSSSILCTASSHSHTMQINRIKITHFFPPRQKYTSDVYKNLNIKKAVVQISLRYYNSHYHRAYHRNFYGISTIYEQNLNMEECVLKGIVSRKFATLLLV